MAWRDERAVAALERAAQAELASLLDAIEVFVRRFVVVDEAQATALALWVPHTWTIEAARSTPYLFITSAEPECGKTRAIEVLRELVRAPLSTMNVSDAALFRAIEARKPTLFFDEVDAVFNPKARERGHRDDLRALLNAGYRRGEVVLRMGGGNNTTLQQFNVFGAKCLAGLGSLPPTLASRCLRIELKRRRVDEPIEDFFPDDVAGETEQLRAALEAWADSALERLQAARPARVEGMRDRTNEVWRPLLAIAELDGEAWAARARRAALTLSTGAEEDDPSLGLLLLADCRTVFDERRAERLATADLVAALGQLEESPWTEWWLDAKTGETLRAAPRRLAQLLKPYDIRSRNVRVGEATPKGYRREDFVDAWERFLAVPRPSATSATSATSAWLSQADVADVADVADRRDGSASRFCDACTTAERCAAEHYCAEIARLLKTEAGEAGRKEEQ
jgi:Protein of unknown function (DUF3631)